MRVQPENFLACCVNSSCTLPWLWNPADKKVVWKRTETNPSRVSSRPAPMSPRPRQQPRRSSSPPQRSKKAPRRRLISGSSQSAPPNSVGHATGFIQHSPASRPHPYPPTHPSPPRVPSSSKPPPPLHCNGRPPGQCLTHSLRSHRSPGVAWPTLTYSIRGRLRACCGLEIREWRLVATLAPPPPGCSPSCCSCCRSLRARPATATSRPCSTSATPTRTRAGCRPSSGPRRRPTAGPSSARPPAGTATAASSSTSSVRTHKLERFTRHAFTSPSFITYSVDLSLSGFPS